jgi:hypothetical protein
MSVWECLLSWIRISGDARRFADCGIRYSLMVLVPPRGADGLPAEHERK